MTPPHTYRIVWTYIQIYIKVYLNIYPHTNTHTYGSFIYDNIRWSDILRYDDRRSPMCAERGDREHIITPIDIEGECTVLNIWKHMCGYALLYMCSVYRVTLGGDRSSYVHHAVPDNIYAWWSHHRVRSAICCKQDAAASPVKRSSKLRPGRWSPFARVIFASDIQT